jgi:putative DNA methylase
MLMAFVSDGDSGRKYWIPDMAQIAAADTPGPDDLPSLSIPDDGLGISVQNYGVTEWSQLFLPRQQQMLASFANAIRHVPGWVVADGGKEEYGRDVASFLGLGLGKLVQAASTIVRINVREGMTPKAEPAFARGDIQLNWDFAETNPFGGSVGDWMQVVTTALRAYGLINPVGRSVVVQADVRESGTYHPGKYVVVTDPPYFAAIGYADLSGYFYYWIRQALKDVCPSLFATVDVPSLTELIASPDRRGGKAAAANYFVKGFTEALNHLGGITHPDFPIVVVYAQQQEERLGEQGATTGWEAMLEAIIKAGLGISGTWPIWGARNARMRGIGSNSLASYVVLVCRPQAAELKTVTRRDFLTALHEELPTALATLRQASVAPVDLAQATLGPGMAVFTR